MPRDIETLKSEAIEMQRKVIAIVDEIYSLNELEGDKITELLTDESFIRA